MKIIVSVKQIPARDSSLRVNSEGTWLDESDIAYEMNEPDAYALEEALQLKEKLRRRGGSTVRRAAARYSNHSRSAGQRGRSCDSRGDGDPAAPWMRLPRPGCWRKHVQPEAPDLILTGLQSDDLGYGQTGVILAELLGYAHATIVMEVEPQGNLVRVKRELEDGWFQNVSMPLPAVLTIQSGIKKLRYATLMGIKKAKTKELKTIPAAELAGGAASASVTKRVYLPQRSKQTQILAGDAKDVAHQLVEKLKFEARVL